MRQILIITAISIVSFSAAKSQSSCCLSKSRAKECHPSKELHAAKTSDMSFYNLSSDWETSEGEVIKMDELKGKIQVVTMIYTSCEYACPRIMADLKVIEKSIKRFGTDKVGIVLITMDPERDTPDRLKEFAAQNKLDKKRWMLLTGKSSDIMEMAALLQVKYKKESSGDISHSNIITVLNEEGEIASRQEGLGTDPSATLETIERLLK